MTEWYYARGGQQSGPVTLEQLRELARSGGLDPAKDLVWSASMKDWTLAGQVAGIFTAPDGPAVPAPVPAADHSNPYAAPQSAWVEPALAAGGQLAEIVPGSDPLDAGICVKRGFEIASRNVGTIVLVALVYIGVSFGLGIIQNIVSAMAGMGHTTRYDFGSNGLNPQVIHTGISAGEWVMIGLFFIIKGAFSIFMGLGLVRIGLNLVSGNEVSVGMMFSQGGKVLTAVLASILFFVAVVIGYALLIVPGVYLALRYGQYMTAIVDRDMGVFEAFSYSSSITTNNRLNLFLFWLLSVVVILAGMLACGVGLLVAIPIVWLGKMVAFRWMQYGHRAAMDQPGTQIPMLAGQ